MEKIGREKVATFHTKDLLIIDLIHREQPIPDEYKSRLPYLADQGVIEKIRGSREHILSGRFHKFMGKRGTYTRKIGLDKEENKALLLKHLELTKEEGCQLKELMQVLPSKSRDQVQYLLRSLREEGKAHYIGYGRVSTWYAGPSPEPSGTFIQVTYDVDDGGIKRATEETEGGTRNAEQINLYADGTEGNAE